MASGYDDGDPIAYGALPPGVVVRSNDGVALGVVEHVLFIESEDIFDGIVIRTADDLRFADADVVDAIYERAVILRLTGEQAQTLPRPEGGAGTFHVDPTSGQGSSLHDRYSRLFRRGGWQRDSDGG